MNLEEVNLWVNTNLLAAAAVLVCVVLGVLWFQGGSGPRAPEARGPSPRPGSNVSVTYEGGTSPEFNLTMSADWNAQVPSDVLSLKQSIITYLNNQPDTTSLCGSEQCTIDKLNLN